MINLLLDLLCGLAIALPHPHVPKAIVVGGAAGKVTVSYFTVPFNAEHLKSLAPGFKWHLGFANLDAGVPLTCGSVKVPAAKYKLDVRRGQTADDWEVVLTPVELLRAQGRGGRRADGEQAAAQLEKAKQDLADKGIPAEIVLPMKAFETAHEEHLAMEVVQRGYTTVSRGSIEPADGVEFTLRMSFGDLHRQADFKETFAGKENKPGTPKAGEQDKPGEPRKAGNEVR